MRKILLQVAILFILQIFLIVSVTARRDCVRKQIPNADTVCVCNATYCDDIPVLQKPRIGYARVYESNKRGDRFVENELKFETNNTESTSNNTVVITIDKSKTYQTIYGFGAAFTDSTGQMLKSVNESLATAIMESYFATNGIEYSMARVPIAGTDYSPRAYSYDDVDGDLELTHFALQKEDFEYKIPYIKQAQKLSAHNIKLFASPWAPPAWMKTNHKVNESGELIGPIGGQYYQSWANYFLKFLDAYKEQGIEYWGLTVENEPWQGSHNEHHPFNCLNFTPNTEFQFVKLNLGPTLAKAGYGKDKVKLMIFDEAAGGSLEDYVNPTRKDTVAEQYVSGIAYHWYSNSPMDHSFPDQLLNEVHNLYPDWFTLNTEACFLDSTDQGRWDLGERYAFDIIRVLANYVTGWIEWNMALDMLGGPRWCLDNGKKEGYGGTLNINPELGEAYKQPAFYTLGHFSKFISPDSIRIGYAVDKQNDKLSVLAVRRADNQTVLVALNAGEVEIVLQINDDENYLIHKLPARSIQSFIW